MGRTHVNRILRTFDRATPHEREVGLNWYANAHAEIMRRLHWLDARTGCGMVAALSPQTAWGRNIRHAVALATTGNLGVPAIRRAKALAILAGADPRTLLNKTTGGYGKERAFYECLLNPGTDSWVVVDGHAWSIWAGRRVELTNVPRFRYADVSADYMRAASRAGLPPHAVQATTWLAWRRIHRVRREVDREAVYIT